MAAFGQLDHGDGSSWHGYFVSYFLTAANGDNGHDQQAKTKSIQHWIFPYLSISSSNASPADSTPARTAGSGEILKSGE